MQKSQIRPARNWKRATHATAFVVTLGLAGWALAQSNPPDIPPERVTVTGSNIKRSDTETADNVQVITAEQIQRSGKETVADYLRSISANFASYNETFTNSFSPGAGSVALRGLSQKNTLVLLNGRRIADYGFAQNLEDTYVDLNIIPANAIDHIDILKDGASSIYGSDAIAGVVNIVLRSDYQERVVEVGYGKATDGGMGTKDTTATLGFGNLETDRFNVMLGISYLQRNELLASQRGYLSGQDFRYNPAGNFNWATSGAYLNDMNPNLPITQVAFPTCGSSGVPGHVVSMGLFPTSVTGTTCAYNEASQTDYIPETERTAIVANGTFKISSELTGFSDLLLSNVRTYATGGPSGLGAGGGVAYNPATGGVTVIPNTLPANNPSNPSGAPQDFVYAFNSVGNGNYTVASDTARLSGGVRGDLSSKWDWEASAGYSENDVTQVNFNAINVQALESALNTGSYDFLDPAATPYASAALRRNISQTALSRLFTADLKFSGELLNLPAGPIQAAIGYEFRHESMDNVPDSQLTSGQILGFGVTQVAGARSVEALFGELEIPILKSLDANFALREEDYSDAGQNLSPKFSLRWQPLDELTFRSSISRGFRAPSLPEISNASSTYFTSVYDPQDPLGRPYETIAGVVTANPHLKPEKSGNFDFGVVFSPTKDTSLTVDYYRIDIDNAVAQQATFQTILDDPSAYPGQIFRTPSGILSYVTVPYENLYDVVTKGIDVDGHVAFHLPAEHLLSFDANFTFVDKMAVNGTPGGPLTNYAGTDGWLQFSPIGGGGPVPRTRGNIGVTLEDPQWVERIGYNVTSGYTEVNCYYYQSCAYGYGGLGANNAAANVGSNSTIDLYLEYRGFKHWKIMASVQNLQDRKPPFDAYDYPFDITLYDAMGRFVSLHVAYQF